MNTDGLVLDFHAHLYPVFDPGEAWSRLLENLECGRSSLPAGSACLGAVVAERRGQPPFGGLVGRGTRGAARFRAEEGSGGGAVWLAKGGRRLLLVRGRQLVTREGLEVLAIGPVAEGTDGLPLGEALARVRGAGAWTALPWAPGKWLGRRGRLVREAVAGAGPALSLCDTLIRPRGLREPRVFAEARRCGMRVLAGSDPLPVRGEERQLGRYATWLRGPFDEERPLASLFERLGDPATPALPAGRRGGLAGSVHRWLRNELVRRM